MNPLLLARNAPGAEIFMVDLPPEAAGDATEADEVANNTSHGVGRRFRDEPEVARITQLLGDTRTFDFSPWFGSIDLVLGDAGHAYENVKVDTSTARKLLSAGGMIVWDDYNDVWPGVIRAVDECGLPVFRLSQTGFAVHDSGRGAAAPGSTDVTIWGVSIARGEEDIIETTVRHMLGQGLDHLLIADNLSKDGTREILARLALDLPITVVDGIDPAYRQSQKMTALANRAADQGAEWIVPFDADELWRAYGGMTVREAILAARHEILGAKLFDHYRRPTLRRGTVVERMPWTKTNPMRKVAFRWRPGATIAIGNHDVAGARGSLEDGVLFIDHYPYRSMAQYQRKVTQGTNALRLAEASEETGWHWRRHAGLTGWRMLLAWWSLRLEPRLRRVRQRQKLS